MKIAAIAWNTFREAIRSKILYTVLLFALGMIVASVLVPGITVGDPLKIIEDIGFATISFSSVLVAVLVGIHLVSQEIQTRTIYTLLAKPVRRSEFLLGKFFGLLLTVGVNLVVMTAVFLALDAFTGGLRAALLLPPLLVFFETAIVIGMALLFSSFSTPITSGVFTLAFYFVGHTSWSFRLLEARLRLPWQKTLCEVLYYVLPELSKFNVKGEVVHGVPIPPGAILAAILYSVAASAVLLLLAAAIFARRDFR